MNTIQVNNQQTVVSPWWFTLSVNSQFTTGSKYSDESEEGHFALAAIKS
jgi:hypothetical protein